MGNSPVIPRIAEFVSSLRFEDLPEEVVQKAKSNQMHNLACAMAGHTVGPQIWPAVRGYGPAEATLLVDGEAVAAEQAAFANAVLVHARAQDDTHFAAKSHIGSSAVPAVFAVAEKEGISGRDALTAIVAAYETAASLGELLAADVTARGFRASGVFGTLGAAAGAALSMGLDRDGVANAIAIATDFSAGLNEAWIEGSSEWRWTVGLAARNGILAARLAAGGARGALKAVEGQAGFARAFAGREGWTADDLDLGQRWRISDVIYKPYPVCNITQSPVMAAIALAKRHELVGEEIAAVRCYLNPADRSYPGTLNKGPFQDVGAALMSAEYCTAMALYHRGATLETLSDTDNQELLTLVARTEVLPDEGLDTLAARVEVEIGDGTGTVSETVIPQEDTYSWEWDGIVAQAKRMAPEMPGGGERLEAVIQHVSTLETAPDVRGLLKATVAA